MTDSIGDEVRKIFGGNIPEPFLGHNPMPAPCANCPFVMADKGHDYLQPGRLDAIKFGVALGQPFYCHKHVHKKSIPVEIDPETGEETSPSWHQDYRQCAGAINYVNGLRSKND